MPRERLVPDLFCASATILQQLLQGLVSGLVRGKVYFVDARHFRLLERVESRGAFPFARRRAV